MCSCDAFALKWYKNDANMQLYGWLAWHCQHETPNRKVDCAESKFLTIIFIPRNQLYDWRFWIFGTITLAEITPFYELYKVYSFAPWAVK